MRYAVVIYTDTTSKEAVADFMERRRKRREREHRRQQHRWYFIKQRLYGIALIVITMLAVMALDGDATIALFTLPLAGYLLFSKEMSIIDNFYWETKERAERESRANRR